MAVVVRMKKYLISGAVLAVIIVVAISLRNKGPGKYDDFATCLVESGTKMYGTMWCGVCADQKQVFGKSWNVFKDQGYVECSGPQRGIQTEICKSEGIERYPTWEFPDDSRQTGKLDFYTLTQKSGCEF